MKKLIIFLIGILIIITCAMATSAAKEKVISGDFSGIINEDGTVTVSGYSGSDYSVEVPRIMEGMTVTGIGFWTFWNDDIFELIIPDTVISIDQNMFVNGECLEDITVNEKNPVFHSEEGVLCCDDELYLYPKGRTDNSYNIPSGIKIIGDNSFSDCLGLEEVMLSQSVEIIGRSAFSDCTDLSEINLQEGLKIIEERAFYNCIGLTSVYIPVSVDEIDSQAFLNCRNISYYDVNPENKTYESVDGLLFNKKESELISFPAAKEDTETILPEGTESIADSAFRFCSALKKIAIPAGVSEIGREAFFRCENLEEISIPASVRLIGENAFSGCGKVILTVAAGSYAEQYAMDNEIKYIAE